MLGLQKGLIRTIATDVMLAISAIHEINPREFLIVFDIGQSLRYTLVYCIAAKLGTGKAKALSMHFVLTRRFLHNKLWQEVCLRGMVGMARSVTISGKSSQQPNGMPSFSRKTISFGCFLMLLYVRTCIPIDELSVKKRKGMDHLPFITDALILHFTSCVPRRSCFKYMYTF